ncbi:MAG: hypothetical protein DIU75_011900 [Mycolicibacterium hassiacum]|jgi:hypothetical protein|uniref:hypothetical protein n=1 Tax=Mycolicibacterium hassiacum TaxID=46351 RepID=UPI000DB0B995|nr:hypothetical protein [Mycolicibacterium hassiacum]MBX5487457.1 hypothetical protein [Mycolicibacterium hassiacum]PZN22219.1 MAG: hypothetical protein DIU75_08280 [Mycolicibacterium hassiacum]
MDEDQFRELVDCLNQINSRLEDLESAVRDIGSNVDSIDFKQGEYCAYTLEDVVKALWDIEKALD